MTVPPLTPANTRRVALAARLAELRAAAGLSGNALAKRMHAIQSRVWKIEHDKLLATEDDIRAWVQACRGDDAETIRELLRLRADAKAEQEFASVFRGPDGAAAYQNRVQGIEERSTRIGEFQVGVIPGILHTADYARELVSLPAGVRTWGTDDAGIESMIAARLRRQEILLRRDKSVQVVVCEAALRTLVTSPAALAGQLEKLLGLIRLPSLELGVIGFGQRVPAYTLGGFRLYDDQLIIVEAIDGERYVDVDADPAKVAAYLEAFSALRLAASHGEQAEMIIQQALAGIRS